MSKEDLAAVIEDPGRAPIKDNERALLAFVIKTVKDPAGVTGQDIDRLRELGWHDSDILDATQMGANMLAARIMNVAFMA
jgi:alkylhydroperoxidase family enzyme